MDTVSKERRSAIMAKVRTRDTAIELAVKPLFRLLGFQHQPKRFGKPDFVHRKWRWVVFIDGCFWHGCPLHCRIPKSNSEYWRKRIERTKARDAKVTAEYEKGGWRVFRVWGHDINAKSLVALIGQAK